MKKLLRMEEMDVNFVSLVDKASNKRKFAIFKSEDSVPIKEGDVVVDEVAESGVAKDYGYDQPMLAPMYGAELGTSFSGAVAAIETQEQLMESKGQLDEYFCILKCVLRGIVADDQVKDKASAMKKAIDEFKSATVGLFKGLPVAKQAEIIDGKGGVGRKGKVTKIAAPASGTVAKAAASGKAAEGGVSQNPQPEGQNRPSGYDTKVDGVGKGKKMTKSEIEAEIQKKKDEKKMMEDEMKAKMKKAEDEEAALLAELQKAGTDQDAGTGRDTVASNGAEGTVAKAGEANQSLVGASNPTVVPAVAAQVGKVNEANGDISAMFESFKKHIDVALDGKLGSMTELLQKQKSEILTEVEKKLAGVQKDVTGLRKTAGLSNAGVPDFDTEAERGRDVVNKSEEGEWSKVTDGFGGLKRSKK